MSGKPLRGRVAASGECLTILEAMAKRLHDNVFIGEDGTALVQRILMKMRFGWVPTGKFETGIDGYIELRDSKSRTMLGAHLAAQVKGWAAYTAETDTGFEFLCEQEHVDYWMRSNLPVLLICVHPDTDEAWYVCVSDYFAAPERRASRRVVFDKRTMRFDPSVAETLRDVALPADSGVPRHGLTGPETLLTNLLPVEACGDSLWSAPTDCRTYAQANARYAEVEGPRASDYLLRDERLYSLRDPRTCELARICDAEQAVAEPVEAWADAGEVDLQRRFSDLLRRTLLQQLKPRLRWQPERALFYFAAPMPLRRLSMVGPTGRKRDVVAVKWFKGRDAKQRVSYVRHQAFRPRFVRWDGQWYLEIEPDWYFSWNGTLEDSRAEERLRFWKGKERNNAVSGHVRFWEQVLVGQVGSLSADTPLLQLGSLRTERAPVGIDDRVWRRQRSGRRPGGGDDQGELAA
jgi:hypothetical protein